MSEQIEKQVRVLYEPVWSHAMSGLKWGALIGIGLKFLDTLIWLFFVDPGLAIMLIIVAGMCAIPRIGIAMSGIVSIAISGFVKVNLLGMFLGVMIIGSILGCLPGMAIGGIVGLARKKVYHSLGMPNQSGMLY
jgi:hypothetical protein